MTELSDKNFVITWESNGRCRTEPGQTSRGDECLQDFNFSPVTMNIN